MFDINSLDDFTAAYIECALWSSTDFETDRPLDDDYGPEDIHADTLRDMIDDCTDFQEHQAELLEHAGDDAQNGHDFWLTRNFHGAGFWDRGYAANIGAALTDAAKVYGSIDLYVGDDGKLYV